MTSQHSDTSSVAGRNVVRVIRRVQCHFVIWHRCRVVVVIQRLHICLTTTAIDIVNDHSFTFNLHEQTFRTGHTSLITTAIEVTDSALLQIPSRTDSHICLIITAKQASYLVCVAAWIREGGIDAHLVLEALIGQQLTCIISIRIASICDTVHHLAGVIHADNCSLCYCSIVSTTIGINN